MMKRGILQAFMLIIALTTASVAYAANPLSVMPLAGYTSQPIGHVDFCHRIPADCLPSGEGNRIVKLDGAAFQQLKYVNLQINTSIRPATDMEVYGVPEYWAYPVTAGDCEDFVLLKQRTLHQAGWPQSALLITVVYDEVGEGHAVLTVRTDKGDLILDNKTDDIQLWSSTPYRYIKRQSPLDPARWEAISDTRAPIAVGSVRAN